MALHVDVIKNNWLAGIQHRVASVWIVKGALQVDADDPDRWRASILHAVPNLSPRDGTRVFLDELHRRWNGSHLFTTEPHDDRDCPFRQRPVSYLQPSDVTSSPGRQAASAR